MGQTSHRVNIVGISNNNPCEITTDIDHGYKNFDFVRLTDLNGAMPEPRGEDPLNNYRFRIIITSLTTFTLQDPITYRGIDSTLFPPYVSGGFCNLIETNFEYNP